MRPPNDLKFATVRLSTGPRIHYVERGNLEGRPVVFLHAYADSWFSYARVLPLLSHEYRAIVPDQRGHGDSDKPEGGYTVDDYAGDVDAFMEAVGVERAVLVGDSSGGMIAQRVALDYPHRVSHLVLIGVPTTLVGNEVVMEWSEFIHTLEDPVPPEFVEGLLGGIIRHPVPEEFLEKAISESLKVPARVWRDYWEGVVLATDDTARLGGIEVPTLILWGEEDDLLPREEQEWRAAEIPDATLRVYTKTGHLAHWARPEWVARDIESFLKETSA